jgi:hypothetical protein
MQGLWWGEPELKSYEQLVYQQADEKNYSYIIE